MTKVRNVLSIVLAILAASTFNASAQTSPEIAIRKADENVHLADGWHGLALVRYQRDKVIELNHALANEEFQLPATIDTRFKLFSVSKQFTAMAAVQLAKEHKLDLDAPISKYIPTLASPWSSVTERQLLQHTAGIPQAFESTWLDEWENQDSADSLNRLAALNGKLPPLTSLRELLGGTATWATFLPGA